MFVEFKHGNSADPFVEEDGSFPKIFNTTCATRGQLVLYATRQQSYQFRTWIISVGIFGNVARLFRWDRTGCLVTAPINYSSTQGNQQLTEFFLRLDLMANKPESRGWDTTVKNPTAWEINRFEAAIRMACKGESQPAEGVTTRSQKEAQVQNKIFGQVYSRLAKSVGDRRKYARRKVSVPNGKVVKKYIVGLPISIPKSPIGRATRGFVALSDEGKLVFLKDSWRPDVESIKPEDYWYGKFSSEKPAEGKRYVGAFSHGSDVYATKKLVKRQNKDQGKRQETVTHHYAGDPKHLVGDMMGYVHHRVVLGKLYLPLESFRNSKHLICVMRDVSLGGFP